MKTILKFKHWQMFMLLIVVGLWPATNSFSYLINVVPAFTFLIWIYAIGIYGQEKLAALELPTLNTKQFKTNSILLSVLVLLAFYFFPVAKAGELWVSLNTETLMLSLLFIYMGYAVFQMVGFACKTLEMLELKREVTFSDYFGDILLMLFLYISIWSLQPKVNKLIGEPQSAS